MQACLICAHYLDLALKIRWEPVVGRPSFPAGTLGLHHLVGAFGMQCFIRVMEVYVFFGSKEDIVRIEVCIIILLYYNYYNTYNNYLVRGSEKYILPMGGRGMHRLIQGQGTNSRVDMNQGLGATSGHERVYYVVIEI